MKKLTSRLRVLGMVALAAAVIAVAVGAGRAGSNRRAVLSPSQNRFLFSASEIIILPGGNTETDSDIARLNTANGAVYRFRGDIDNASVRNTWELRVPPVKKRTSGLLEIQQLVLPKRISAADPTGADPAVTFLVDLVNGDTWILRQRASTNASWEPVEIFR